MAPSFPARVAIVCLLALAAAGCDRQSPPSGQANVAAPGEAAANVASPDEAGTAAAPTATIGLERSHKGSPAPTVSFAGPDGKPVTLAAFKGKPVLVNLWATWCGPCIVELPTLQTLAASNKVRVVAISQDSQDPAKVPGFLKAHGAPAIAPYVDSKMALSLAYQANLPTTILFDSAGKEVWRWNGGNDWSGAPAAALIAEAS